MAPEVLNGKPYNKKVDVFSYGIILCELISRLEADPEEIPRSKVRGGRGEGWEGDGGGGMESIRKNVYDNQRSTQGDIEIKSEDGEWENRGREVLEGWRVVKECGLASFSGPAQLLVACNTVKWERAWYIFSHNVKGKKTVERL